MPTSNRFLDDLAARRRFGMRPGLEPIQTLCEALGNPQTSFRAIHVAGTNGKGAVCTILASALQSSNNLSVGLYTSPHLVRLNERFSINGNKISDEKLEKYAKIVENTVSKWGQAPGKWGQTPCEVTFFEALTAVAFLFFADEHVDVAVLECGLGGRLDATNICNPEICVITRIGLDHCDWLGDTIEKIAAEKAGIIKPGVPVVLGGNEASVRAVVESRARELGAPFFYAPDLADETEIPTGFPLRGAFNHENAVTALAALKVLKGLDGLDNLDDLDRLEGLGSASLSWPGRFQRVGGFLIDGAHNPPAAVALAAALEEEFPDAKLPLVAGFCGDKDVLGVLRPLAPHVSRGFAVRTCNPRSLSAGETAARMAACGIAAEPCGTLSEALGKATAARDARAGAPPALVCGSLFLAGEALVALGALAGDACPDPSEQLVPDGTAL